MSLNISVVGGTGPQGRGLAYRFALSGHAVTIGSRDATRAQEKADEINVKLGASSVSGATNADAVQASDIVLLAVPWDGHADLVLGLSEQLAGKLVISCVNPLGFDQDGPFGLVLEESAAQETQRLVPTARVVGAFHHVAALSLWKTPDPLSHDDVLVCGDDADAKDVVQDLAASVTGKRGIDAGALRLARQLEPLTAVLISMNKRYKTRSGVAVTGVEQG
ncbi:NADPH-dependent F420 reductase [Aeromicrobium fastidiosum]|uniref:NADPH-dependent F420 reductase n=1 Tax=Aeromicrobium fastidiosum TaxID=52699 RepID=A0A641APL9_9ACTN|nr:NADPH-dependent F420 reductase [Aeromicrobium fastidiosum]KAA1379879.1 NADPH-dependent F420 reductase [Aeromicrobium fastidiosum]MBP2389383.1 NADPH-dependent F420 reductase [Aeromicrobium fastidiosum]